MVQETHHHHHDGGSAGSGPAYAILAVVIVLVLVGVLWFSGVFGQRRGTDGPMDIDVNIQTPTTPTTPGSPPDGG
jgi:hypothetical protein